MKSSPLFPLRFGHSDLSARAFCFAALLCLLCGEVFAATQELLTNGGFEPPYSAVSGSNSNGSYTGNLPNAWTENSLNGGSHVNNTYSEETSNTISGSALKAVIDYAPGFSSMAKFAILQQPAHTVVGRPLTASVWMKASANCTVRIYFQDAVGFAARGSMSFPVTTTWTQFTYVLTPAFTESVQMLILFLDPTPIVPKPVTLWMDQASLTVQETDSVFYVSPSGSDTTGNGSLATPYQTITKAMSLAYPGDTIQLRGGIYREAVQATQSGTAAAPITITNYNGEAVTVTGADVIAGPWAAGSNGIFTASAGWDLTEGLNNVFVDGTMVHEAQEPNYGAGDLLHPGTASMTVTPTGTQASTTATIDSTITSTLSSKPANFYAGARLHAGIGLVWNWQAATIASSTGNTLSVTAAQEASRWFTGTGVGYVYGLLSLLDADNEWFLQHNPSAPHTLFLRLTGQADPTGHLVELRHRTYTIDCNGKNYIVIRGLNLRCGDVQMNGTGDVLDRCDASYLSHFITFSAGNNVTGGIIISGTSDTVSNCTIHDTAGCGIQLRGTGHLITRNLLYNTDYSGTFSSAIASVASLARTGDNTITFNTAHHSGRDVLLFVGGTSSNIQLTQGGCTVEYNEFYEPDQMCHDSGCIYATTTNGQGTTGNPTRLAYNWVHDNNVVSTAYPGVSLRILIYLDNWCRNFVIDHNVCWNGTGDSSIRLNGPNTGHKIYHNTLYNSGQANTNTFTMPFSDPSNPETTFYNSSGNYTAPDIRNDLYLNATPDAQLTNSAAFDFRPKAGAAAIDSATLIPGYNDSYIGAAPDQGAYEAGGAYWVPGVNGWSIDQPGSTSSMATSVGLTTATANGTLISPGTATTAVNLYWGTSDGSTVPAAWAHVTALGATYSSTYQALSSQLTGLTPGTTYWYRYRSTSANGDTWSTPQSFSTLPDASPPVVAITSPTTTPTFSTTSASLTLSGTATDNAGVAQVAWTNDRGGSGTATGTGAWSVTTIALQPGVNVLTVTTSDVAGNATVTTLTVTRQTASGVVYYVSPTGNNSSNGTSTATPFLTIQKGVNMAGGAPGNTVYIRAGTYREDVEVNGNVNLGGAAGNYANIFAYPGERPVLKGSQVVTAWTNYSGSIWMKTSWTTNSQQVFVDFDTAADQHPLQQIGRPPNSNSSANEYPSPVGSGLADMAPGRFYWDSSSNTLYVQLSDNTDPNTHVMEASTTLRTLFIGGSKGYFYIKGLTFYHNNASASKPVGNPAGSMVNVDSNCVLDSCNVQWSDFGGVAAPYQGTNALVTNCTIANNGDCGFSSVSSGDFLLTNCLVTGNNYRNWNQQWNAGGMKFAGTTLSGVVEHNEIANNNGTGVWCDGCDGTGTKIIRYNYIHNNGPVDLAEESVGIHFEISKNALIYDNLLVDNERRGIYISGSDSAKIYNNTIVRQRGHEAINVDGMPRAGHTLTNNLVYNNIIYNNTSTVSTADLFIRQNDGNDIVGNTSDYNCIYRSTGAIQLTQRSTPGSAAQSNDGGVTKTDLASWRTLTGWDTHSISTDPAFVSGLGVDFSLTTNSPAKDSGTNLPEVPTDYLGTTRPQGSSSDIGAFEVPDTTAPVIAIISPTSNSTYPTTSSPVALSGTATDDTGIAQVTWVNSRGGSGTASLGSGTWSAAAIPLLGGDNIITVTAADAAGNKGTAILTATWSSTFASWQSQNFNTTQLADPNFSGTNADPNHNGILNLTEYAFGGDPVGSTTGQGVLPSVGRSSGNTLQLTFTRYLDRADLTLTVEAADSLAGAWTALARSTAGAAFVILAPGATAPENGTGNARGVTVTDLYQVTDPAHPRRFLRLEVSQ